MFVCGCRRERPKRQPGRRARPSRRLAPEHGSPLLTPIGYHECRHSYVPLMHDAGFTLERIGDYVGHSSTYMTDRYRHLIEGHEMKAATRFDEYVLTRTGARTGAQGRLVAVEGKG